MIRRCEESDFDQIWTTINDGAEAYRGIIPSDRWHEPYMTRQELQQEIENGVCFFAYEQDGGLQAVMGAQDIKDVTLIRHAYVRQTKRRAGLGGRLLEHLKASTTKPLLVGTWEAATWAIHFYEKHGFQVVSSESKNTLLRTYWSVPERQMETSIVLRATL